MTKIKLNKPVEVIDASKPQKPKKIKLQPGEYTLDEIRNPLDPKGKPWLVTFGTKIGMSKAGWQAQGIRIEQFEP